MPLPLILGAGAAIAGATGVASGANGAVKMKKASDKQRAAQLRYNDNLDRFEHESRKTTRQMDSLGELELNLLKSFERFSAVFEKIQNRPEFRPFKRENIFIPQYDGEVLKKVSIGAGALLGGLGGAAVGTAGGFAAAGATTAAVMALGTASTGTAIASLSGAAAVNATLAALGGGALAAGGGGMALGATILSASTLGVGLLVGGIIFNFAGNSLSDKADEAWEQMLESKDQVNQICQYLKELYTASNRYKKALLKVQELYDLHLKQMERMILQERQTNWNTYTKPEKIMVENTVLLVGLLYNMCKVQLVCKAKEEGDLNTINQQAIDQSITNADRVIHTVVQKESVF